MHTTTSKTKERDYISNKHSTDKMVSFRRAVQNYEHALKVFTMNPQNKLLFKIMERFQTIFKQFKVEYTREEERAAAAKAERTAKAKAKAKAERTAKAKAKAKAERMAAGRRVTRPLSSASAAAAAAAAASAAMVPKQSAYKSSLNLLW